MRDIGYMAQRSSNPKAVLDFLNALPPGTLESGIDDIPLDEVRKQFKLRSPKMTKALVKLGVHPDVVAGYYAGFTKEDIKPFVYHMTTFPHPEIMEQQSASQHFRSCMYNGVFDDSPGSHYDDNIDHDISAYEKGDLGMLVVGAPFSDVGGYKGGGVGFLMRAKIRLLYDVESNELRCVLMDKVYGQRHLLREAARVLLEWASVYYPGTEVITSRYYFGVFRGSDELFDTSTSLYYPHSGYHDTLREGKGEARLDATKCDNFVVMSNTLVQRSLCASTQLKIYKAVCKDVQLSARLPMSLVYINRSTDSISKMCTERTKQPSVVYSRTRPMCRFYKRLGVFNTRFVNLTRVLVGHCKQPLPQSPKRCRLSDQWWAALEYGESLSSDDSHFQVEVTIKKVQKDSYWWCCDIAYYCRMSGAYKGGELVITGVVESDLFNNTSIADESLRTPLKNLTKLLVNAVYLEPIDKTKPKVYNSGVAYLKKINEKIQQLRDCTKSLKELQ